MVDIMSPKSSQLRLGGISEVADELRVSRQQVAKLRARPDFPAPAAELAVGDIWDLDMIHRWASSGLRRGPGRPGSASRRTALGRRFELGEEISRGGFATIYQARDLTSISDERVAVKVLTAAEALDENTIARFERELTLLGELDDPHVVQVLASGTDEQFGQWYAMPLAQSSLEDTLREPRSTTKIVDIMREICAGLIYVHDQDILHRDLKPANVLRTVEGNWALADFGLARAVVENETRITRTMDQIGTQFYTAPEQWDDAKRVDERADVFSAGKILQALVLRGTPVDDEVSGVFRPVILKAISPQPRRRYPSAVDFLTAIETVVATPRGRWENPEERGIRLRPRLEGARSADNDAMAELIEWAESVDSDDYEEMGPLAVTLSALSGATIGWWWGRDPDGFTRVFVAFADRLCGSFSFGDCDQLADFAGRAVAEAQDGVILREAIRGLVSLGQYHNRWHVRDVAVAILQRIRTDEDAVAAVEGLRAADAQAVDWTVSETALRTFHPILRAGIGSILGHEDSLDEEPR
jgi:tRNA A-37 threonylcarbamoyl transferase component Bud32